MLIYTETPLHNFEFWSGGKDRADVLTYEQLDELDDILSSENPDGIDETQLNDLFWFEEDYIAQLLGFEDFESLEKFNNGEDDDDDEYEEEEE